MGTSNEISRREQEDNESTHAIAGRVINVLSKLQRNLCTTCQVDWSFRKRGFLRVPAKFCDLVILQRPHVSHKLRNSHPTITGLIKNLSY